MNALKCRTLGTTRARILENARAKTQIMRMRSFYSLPMCAEGSKYVPITFSLQHMLFSAKPAIYDHVKTKIRIATTPKCLVIPCHPVSCQKGVRQGRILSPLLLFFYSRFGSKNNAGIELHNRGRDMGGGDNTKFTLFTEILNYRDITLFTEIL